jgi:peroxiredoxin Q/BCP
MPTKTPKARTSAKGTKRPRPAGRKPANPAATRSRQAGSRVVLGPGDPAPKFALPDQRGAVHRLADHAGRKLLVYFYPKADTPGCTTQSCSVRDARRSLAKRGVDVVGISPDKPAAQERFDAKYELGFPLLADEDHAVAEAFGVWGEKSMYGRKYMGIVRSAFLIDERGRIVEAWYGVSPKDTVPGAEAALGA